MADELDTVLVAYQVGYRDAIEEILCIATEKLKEKIEEIKTNTGFSLKAGTDYNRSTTRTKI